MIDTGRRKLKRRLRQRKEERRRARREEHKRLTAAGVERRVGGSKAGLRKRRWISEQIPF
jgi:hypothetical protein